MIRLTRCRVRRVPPPLPPPAPTHTFERPFSHLAHPHHFPSAPAAPPPPPPSPVGACLLEQPSIPSPGPFEMHPPKHSVMSQICRCHCRCHCPQRHGGWWEGVWEGSALAALTCCVLPRSPLPAVAAAAAAPPPPSPPQTQALRWRLEQGKGLSLHVQQRQPASPAGVGRCAVLALTTQQWREERGGWVRGAGGARGGQVAAARGDGACAGCGARWGWARASCVG